METGGKVVSNTFHFINEGFFEILRASKRPYRRQGLIKCFLCQISNVAKGLDSFVSCTKFWHQLGNGWNEQGKGGQGTIISSHTESKIVKILKIFELLVILSF